MVDSDDKAISFVNTITNSKIIVRYFQCNDTQAQNCNLFAESFQKNGLPYVRDKYNNMYYKLNDQNTWFVQLDDNYGVYIETNDEALFSLFVQNSQFITRQRATLELQQQAKSLCVQENQQLKDITKSILETQDKSVRWTVE